MKEGKGHKDLDPRGIIGQIARIRELSNLLIEQELRARNIVGIVPAHGSVLAFLFNQVEPIPIKDIVESVGRVKSTITGVLNNLERYGFVCRIADATDSRVKRIKLTNKGRALEKDFDAISKKLQQTVYGAMSAQEQRKVVELLDEIERNLRKFKG